MHNSLHLRINVDHLYIHKKEDGRGLQGVKGAVNLTNLQLEKMHKSLKSVCLLLRHL